VFTWTQVSTDVASPSLTCKVRMQCFFSSQTFLISDRAASEAEEMRITAAGPCDIPKFRNNQVVSNLHVTWDT